MTAEGFQLIWQNVAVAGVGRRRRNAALAVSVCFACLLLVAGCESHPLPKDPQREATYALENPRTTLLGRTFAQHAPDGEQSGISLVETGGEALTAMRSYIALAEKTIDLQYYIWRNDESGRLLLRDLLQAAGRGVRVRLLLDDMEKAWPDDKLARLNADPNFEVRLFNPFSRERGRWLDAIVDFDRITHRMHNKMIIADNTMAVIGGRNIGDSYFAADRKASFRDLDLHAAGPVVRDLSASFDAFWNSYWSVSVAALDGEGGEVLTQFRNALEKLEWPGKPAEGDSPPRPFEPKKFLAQVLSKVAWTRDISVLADSPKKLWTERSKLLQELAAKLPRPRSELLMETAFLVPGKEGVDALCALVRSGVRVRILTNSLASIDSLTAYAGYWNYRHRILKCGVELHELQPNSIVVDKDWTSSRGSSSSILHTKAALIDGRSVFVGSYNIDPRSTYLNTEIALLVRDPDVAAATARFIEKGMSPERSYRLTLEEGDIVWHAVQNGKRVRLTDEPGATLWGRVITWLISLLPIERQI